MAGWLSDIVAVIDARIRANAPAVTRMGTVTSQAVDSSSAPLVLLDGDTVSVPVKQFGTVIARGGDRVGCVRFGSDWVIVGSYGANRPQDVLAFSTSLSAGTTTSTTGVALPGAPSVRFRKERNDSHLILTMHLGGVYATAVPTNAYGMAYFKGDTGVAVDTAVDVVVLPFATASSFSPGFGQVRIPTTLPGTAWPAGWYTVTPWWRRNSGASGTLTAEARSSVALRVQEVQPALTDS